MTPEQAAAFINAQTVCAHSELAAMQEANHARAQMGEAHAYDEAAFRAVQDQFCIGHNAVLGLFREING